MRSVAIALTLVLLAACGDGDEVVTSDEPRTPQTSTTTPPRDEPAPSTTAAASAAPADPPAQAQRYTATATVLESPDHGPQLCLGGVADSYPPQCGGPDVIGWDWDHVPSKESANGTTWGSYTVVGTWDGRALTLTEPPSEPRPPEPPDDEDRFATPCPEPQGGWQVVDPAKATDEAMQQAIAYAQAQPSVGGVWLDQSINPAAQGDEIDEERMNDPTRLVVNATFTDDLATHEAAMRERWGGPLCVSQASASMVQLEEIRQQLHAELGDRVTDSSIDVVEGQVELGVTVDDGLQQRFDERYGDGVVEVDAALRPVAG